MRTLTHGLVLITVLIAAYGQEPNAPPGAATKPPPGADGQTPGAAATPSSTPQPQDQTAPATPGASLSIDLPGALQRAQTYNQQFLSAGVATALAHEDRVQAKAALYPTISYFNQYIYTQGNGTPSGVF